MVCEKVVKVVDCSVIVEMGKEDVMRVVVNPLVLLVEELKG